MKILHTVHGWFPEHRGGTESYVARLVRDLAELGHEVALVSGSQEARDEADWTFSEWHDVPLYTVHRTGLYLDSWYRSYSPQVDAIFREILDDFRPDVVHVHHWYRLTRNLLEICAERGVPAICTLHDTSTTCPKFFRIRDESLCSLDVSGENCGSCVDRFWFQEDPEVHGLIEAHRDDYRRELSLARHVVAPSRALRDVVLEHVPEVRGRITVLPLGALDAPPAGRVIQVERDAHLRLVYWGALQQMKGVGLLLDAVARLPEPEAVSLDLWGTFAAASDDFEAGVRERARKLKVQFLGEFEAEEIPIGTYDLAVFPSICLETYSFTTDEAWQRGLPVIVPDRGAPSERLAGGGATFAAEDAADLTRILQGVLDDPDRLDGWRQEIVPPPSVAACAAPLIELYESAAAAGPMAPLPDADACRLARTRMISSQLEARDRRVYDLFGRVGQEHDRATHLEVEVGIRDEVAARKEEVLTGFNANLRELTAALRSRDEQLQKLNDLLLSRTEQFERRLADRDRVLTTKREELESFARSTNELRLEVDRAAATLVQRDATIVERDAAVARLEEARRSLGQELEAKEQSLVEARGIVAERNRALDEFARSAEELLESLSAAKAELDAVRSARDGLERQRAESERALVRRSGELETTRAELARVAEAHEQALASAARLERAVALLERAHENLRVELDERSAALALRDQTLDQAVDALTARERRLEEVVEVTRRRLAPIARQEGPDQVVADAAPEALIDRVVTHHGRLHALIRERDELLELLTRKVDELEEDGSATHGRRSARKKLAEAGLELRSRVGSWRRRLKRYHPQQRLKILYVVHDFLPKHAAGTEIYTYNLARELASRHDIHLLFCEARYDRPRYEVTKGTYDGLPYTEVVHNYRWESFEETYHDPRMERIFADVLEEVRPDLVHVQHLHYFSFNFIFLAKARAIPVIYTLHEFMMLCARGGQLLREDLEICEQPVPEKCADCIRHHPLAADYGQPGRRRVLERTLAFLPDGLHESFQRIVGPLVPQEMDAPTRQAYARAAKVRLDFIGERAKEVDLFISPSAFLRQKFIDSGMIAADRIVHLDNGFDVSLFEGLKRVHSEVLRFGFVGTIAEYKGVHVLTEAFNEIRDEGVELQIWGDVEIFADYKTRLKESIRSPRIKLMGAFENKRIATVLAGIDVLIVPSLWFENSPLTIHEAWLAGVPVIASDRGGMAELVDDGVNGLHFRLGDPEDLRAKVRRVIADRTLLAKFRQHLPSVSPIAEHARDVERLYYRQLVGPKSE